ncbi:MAG: box helicase, partial [Paenibacillus sp.]|nr:box helicase [Paenibacillus sp.]
AERLVSNIIRQRTVCAVPTDKHVVIEQYKDDADRIHLIIHSLFGRRLNRTWQLVLQRTFEKLLPYRFYTNAKENGIEFVFPEWDDAWIDLIRSVTADQAEPLLRESIAGSPLFGATFRRLAETSLLLARSYGRTPMWVKRIRSEALLRDVLPFADQFPLVQETLDICLEQLLDTKQFIPFLEAIGNGTIHVSVHKSLAPSPYAFQFISEYMNSQMYESDALAKDIQLQLMTVNRDAAVRVFGTTALKQLVEQLDPEGTGEWAARSPQPADEDELYRLLKQRGDSTEDELIKLVDEERVHEWLELLRGGSVQMKLRHMLNFRTIPKLLRSYWVAT